MYIFVTHLQISFNMYKNISIINILKNLFKKSYFFITQQYNYLLLYI